MLEVLAVVDNPKKLTRPSSAISEFQRLQETDAFRRKLTTASEIAASGQMSLVQAAIKRDNALRRVIAGHNRVSELVRSPAWLSAVERAGAASRALEAQREPLLGMLARANELSVFSDRLVSASKAVAAASVFQPLASYMKSNSAVLGATFADVPSLNVLRQAPDLLGMRLASQMSMIQSAWASSAHPELSILRFARLTGIADVIREERPFSPDAGAFLQEVLGSGGDASPEVAPEERDAVAVEAGLDPDLIDFPELEFGPVTEAAGFRIEVTAPDPMLSLVGDIDVMDLDASGAGLVLVVERHLRKLISDTLASAEGGEVWVKRRVDVKVRQRWAERKAEAIADGGVSLPLIYYADFMDLKDIVLKKDSWPLFSDRMGNYELFTASMMRLHPVRKAVAHGRPLSRAEQLYLMADGGFLLRALEAGRLI